MKHLSAMNATRPRQLVFDLGHGNSFAEDDFIVSEANRLAFEHIVAYPAWSASLTLVTGPEKSGKSHLAAIWQARSDASHVTPANLEEQASIGPGRPLIVEDVDRLGYAEQPLFHLLNRAMRDTRPLLMTARAPVAEWPFVTADVTSRARLASHFSVRAADDTLLSQMFVKLLADRQLPVEPKTVRYLVARMERSPAEVVALTSLLDTLALTRGRAISRAIAAEALTERERLRTGGEPAEEIEE